MISFTRIAKAVLAEGQYDPINEESDIKRLNRKFNRFVEALGISATSLKDSRSRMYFNEEAVPVLKGILKQLDKERKFDRSISEELEMQFYCT